MGLRFASLLAFAAGGLLLVGQVLGGTFALPVLDAFVGQAEAEAIRHAPAEYAAAFPVAASLLVLVAGFGGLAVLAGAWMYARGRRRTGNVLVGLGCGTGVLGIALLASLSYATGALEAFAHWMTGPTGAGVALALLARREARPAAIPGPLPATPPDPQAAFVRRPPPLPPNG
ncbi:MAG TPA: hypothetical protein VGR28_15415 [Candidatus Thermoplasmatota archaeon]|jgi:hypothetical protein|nr:hypothetical protein [Candidatus Thermoplasmatota archaeon]